MAFDSPIFLSKINSNLKELRIQTLNKTNFIIFSTFMIPIQTQLWIQVVLDMVILSRINSNLKKLLEDSHGWYLVYTSEDKAQAHCFKKLLAMLRTNSTKA